jgi:hypothetical protein
MCLLGALLLTSAQGAIAAKFTPFKLFKPLKPSRTVAVPEPATLALIVMGLAGVGVLRRRNTA